MSDGMVPTFVFVDIETTGLDPTNDEILELGLIVTDGSLNEIARDSWCVHVPRSPSGAPLVYFSSQFVAEMHEASGLLEECMASKLRLHDVEAMAVMFMRQHAGAEALPMAGNTVSFDRNFLRQHMSGLHEHFHYRNLDVSSFKVAARVRGVPPAVLPEKPAHRAIPDLEASLAELGHYFRYFGIAGVHEAFSTAALAVADGGVLEENGDFGTFVRVPLPLMLRLQAAIGENARAQRRAPLLLAAAKAVLALPVVAHPCQDCEEPATMVAQPKGYDIVSFACDKHVNEFDYADEFEPMNRPLADAIQDLAIAVREIEAT